MDDKEAFNEATKEMRGVAHEVAQQFMSDAQFDKRFRNTVKIAKRNFEKDSSHDMMVFAHLRHHETKVWRILPMLMIEWPPPKDKYKAMQGLGAMIAEKHPDEMLFLLTQVSEGWAAYGKKTDVEEDDPRIMKKDVLQPSERPDRIEVLMVSAMTIDQRQSYSWIEIKRDKAGKFKKWGEDRGVVYEPGSTALDPTQSGNFLLTMMFAGYARSHAAKAGITTEDINL